MYKYKDHRERIFTEEGQREFLKVRDTAKRLLKDSGAFTMFAPLKGICGNSWDMMAYVDRLLELGEIREVNQIDDVFAQYRVFVKAR